MTHPLDKKIAVEFIGTFLFLFTIGMATEETGAGALAPLAIGAGLMVMVFAGGHISGGHFNPAVSTAVFLRGRMASNEWTGYVAAQFVAAILAGLMVRIVGGEEATADFPGAGRMLLAEFLFTFALAWVVLNVATARGTEGNSFYGLAIGFTVAARAFAVGGGSGGPFNPAVPIGAMIMGILSWSDIWIYLLANLLGGAAAAQVFLFTQPGEKITGDVRAAEPGGGVPGDEERPARSR